MPAGVPAACSHGADFVAFSTRHVGQEGAGRTWVDVRVCIEDLDALARSYFALSGTLAFTVDDDLIDSLDIHCHDDTVTVSEDS